MPEEDRDFDEEKEPRPLPLWDAIDHLKVIREDLSARDWRMPEQLEALDMAIEALRARERATRR